MKKCDGKKGGVCVQIKKKRMKIEDTEERLLKRIRRSEGIVSYVIPS